MKKNQKRNLKKSSVKSSVKKNKFIFDTKTWGILGIAFLLIVALFFVVSLNNSTSNSTGNTISGKAIFEDFWDSWKSGENVDFTLVKILFLLMITILIFSILSFVGIFSSFVSFILALIISFLATAYITPEEIFTILTTYSALGLALAIIIPYFILLMFSVAIFSARRNARSAGISMMTMRIFINLIMWLLFETFVVYRVIRVINENLITWNFFSIVLIVIAGLTFLIIIFHKYFIKFIVNMKITAIGLSAAEQTQIATMAR